MEIHWITDLQNERERERERDLDLRRGRGGVKVVGEGSHGAH